MVDYVPAPRTLPDAGSALTLTGENLMITAVKQSYRGDSLIVRILNYGDTESTGTLSLSFPGLEVACVYETDLDENRTAEAAYDNGKASFALRQAGLLTLEIVMK